MAHQSDWQAGLEAFEQDQEQHPASLLRPEEWQPEQASLLDIAFGAMDGVNQLTAEHQAALAETVRLIRDQPEMAHRLAIEKHLAMLLLKQQHERCLKGLRASGFNWLERWRIMHGHSMHGEAD